MEEFYFEVVLNSSVLSRSDLFLRVRKDESEALHSAVTFLHVCLSCHGSTNNKEGSAPHFVHLKSELKMKDKNAAG